MRVFSFFSPIFIIFGAPLIVLTCSQMKDIDLILLNAKVDAMRTYFISLLPVIFRGDKEKDSKVWLAKYTLWQFERESLAPYDYTTQLGPHERERISRRRFQLQVLMDVAYIQGRLEEYDILRKVDSYAAAQALQVFEKSADGSEESMIPLIDAL